MKKKNILIVTHGFFPEQSPRAFRATELAKELRRQGHQLTVMAPYRDGTAKFLNDSAIAFKSLGPLKWKISNLADLGLIGRLYNKAVNRLLPLLFEYPMMELYFKIRKALKAEPVQYDLLISVAVPYPIHWGVASVWNAQGADNPAKVWVADCGDPYMGRENDTFYPPFYFGWIEKWFCRKADYLTVPTSNSYKGYYPEFHPKIKVIPQGFRFEEVATVPHHGQPGKILFGYGGAFIPGMRDPRELLDFLTGLPLDFQYEFHIYTTQWHLVEPYLTQNPRIFLHAPIPRLALLKQLSGFDFVVNFGNSGTAQTPSKLIDYAIIGKPILQVDTGAFDKAMVSQFLAGNYSQALVVKNPDQYRIENVARQFLALA